MRPCSYCISVGEFCVLSTLDERCEQCYRGNRSCDLASPWAEDDRLKAKEEILREKRLRAEAEAVKIRKAERKLQKQRRLLWEREKQNIAELEVDELLAGAAAAPSEPAPGVPPGPAGPSQVSSGSPGRTSPVPTGSS